MRSPDTYCSTRRNNSRWTAWTAAMYHEDHTARPKHRLVRYSGAERERDEAERAAKAERAKWDGLRQAFERVRKQP